MVLNCPKRFITIFNPKFQTPLSRFIFQNVKYDKILVMPTHELSIVELEAQASQEIVKAFPTLDDFRKKITQLGELILESQPPISNDKIEESDLVCRNLFYRLMTDIFAISRLAFTGYSLQAATLASSSFESAFVIMYVGANNANAKKWSENPSLTHSPLKIKEYIREVMECEGLVEQKLIDETNKFYKIYQQMCGAKHANVHIQGHFQQRTIEDETRLEYGADSEPRSIWLSAWTLTNFFILFLLSSRAFTASHVIQPKQSELLTNINDLLTQSQQLTTDVNNYATQKSIENNFPFVLET